MPKQKLNSEQVYRASIDQRRLHPEQQVRARFCRVQTNVCHPLTSFTYALVGSTGRHLHEVIERFGIAEQMKDNITLNQLDGVAQTVTTGEVELAIGGIPSLLPANGVQLSGPFPAELQRWFVNSKRDRTGEFCPLVARNVSQQRDRDHANVWTRPSTRYRTILANERPGVPERFCRIHLAASVASAEDSS